jgi:lipoprotein-releasing system ATP-binding protein
MANVLELNNVNKIYGTVVKTQALSNINLRIEEGSFNSIIGQSGSGKSTLLNVIGTLDQPTSGEIYINGILSNKMNKNELAKLRNQTIGFIFQFHFLLPEFTAKENILIPYLMNDKPVTPEIDQRAEELIELMGLQKVKNNLANQMSGGQQQRTAIARALINNPKMILADEPTGNLDSDTTETVYKLMREVNKKYGTTFLIVTHDRKIAERTDRIIEIKDGKVILDVQNKAQ